VTAPALEAQQRLQHVLGLSAELAARAVAETLDSLRLGVDDYIALRHSELQAARVNNQEIYERIAEELRGLRFVAPPLTARQIRRRVYG
jgi:hypothetical protein